MIWPRRFSTLLIVFAFSTAVAAQNLTPRIKVAVLDFGETQTGRLVADKLARILSSDDRLKMTDRDEARAAARGSGYTGSLNMTLEEARDLGAAIGCDFYVTGDAQTLRRSPSTGPVYYEAYASVFIVSTSTGRLARWDRPSFNAASAEAATESLLKSLGEYVPRYADAVVSARDGERAERAKALERAARGVDASPPLVEDAPDDEAEAARQGLRLPQPYRRLRPAYPETAARAEAEATVDVRVEIDARGEVARTEVTRWAGFGLDEAALDIIRQLHFSPARRGGVAVPMRVLLRYNFRRPAKENKNQ
jgi:TonB family protein